MSDLARRFVDSGLDNVWLYGDLVGGEVRDVEALNELLGAAIAGKTMLTGTEFRFLAQRSGSDRCRVRPQARRVSRADLALGVERVRPEVPGRRMRALYVAQTGRGVEMARIHGAWSACLVFRYIGRGWERER